MSPVSLSDYFSVAVCSEHRRIMINLNILPDALHGKFISVLSQFLAGQNAAHFLRRLELPNMKNHCLTVLEIYQSDIYKPFIDKEWLLKKIPDIWAQIFVTA